MTCRFYTTLLIVFVLSGTPLGVSAEWQLINEESSIVFISIKNSKAAEIHTFSSLYGSLSDSGSVALGISLNSLDTKIPLRDTRMKEMLFEVIKFPVAKLSTTVDIARISQMKPGETATHDLKLILSLYGEENPLNATIRVVRLSGNKLLVSTLQPVIVNADDFSMGKGIELLRGIANLSSISSAVPVTVSLIFDK